MFEHNSNSDWIFVRRFNSQSDWSFKKCGFQFIVKCGVHTTWDLTRRFFFSRISLVFNFQRIDLNISTHFEQNRENYLYFFFFSLKIKSRIQKVPGMFARQRIALKNPYGWCHWFQWLQTKSSPTSRKTRRRVFSFCRVHNKKFLFFFFFKKTCYNEYL